jgi:hypothetical protein
VEVFIGHRRGATWCARQVRLLSVSDLRRDNGGFVVRRPGCGGDSGLTPGSGSARDKGNRSSGLSFCVRFGLELGLG